MRYLSSHNSVIVLIAFYDRVCQTPWTGLKYGEWNLPGIHSLRWRHNGCDSVSNHQPIVYSIVYSDADQKKHQSSASLAFAWWIHREPVNSPHKWPVTQKSFHLMTSSCSRLILSVNSNDRECFFFEHAPSHFLNQCGSSLLICMLHSVGINITRSSGSHQIKRNRIVVSGHIIYILYMYLNMTRIKVGDTFQRFCTPVSCIVIYVCFLPSSHPRFWW